MTTSGSTATSGPAWLGNAIFYQIYPQSFSDSNADGIGDLPGVIERLDYLQALGVNALWLNPCFVSPFGDAGYDVADFYTVAPRYGTNSDLYRLFDEAHARGMRVVLDLVAGHTSVEHPWFKASAGAEKNSYSDWYLWTDSVWSSGVPSMPPVRGLSERNGGFVPNFFAFQPALNYGFANPDPDYPWQQAVNAPGPQAVRQELRNIMAFWLDQGCDGFRVDMAASLVKNDPGSRMTIRLWQDIRAWIDSAYPHAALLAEWSYPMHAIEAGFHVDFYIHFNTRGYTALFRKNTDAGRFSDRYGFSFFERAGLGNIREFLDEYLVHYEATRGRGYISIPTGNHDISPRLAAARTLEELTVAYVFLLTMPGIPTIYYGDEIGMVSIAGLPSWEGGYERTEARTPMQWHPGPTAGFSAAPPDQLYLPIERDPGGRTVAEQEADPDSLLHRVRGLIKLRQGHPALNNRASFTPLYAERGRYPFVYARQGEGENVIIAVNPADRPGEAIIPATVTQAAVQPVYGPPTGLTWTGEAWQVRLPGVSAGVYLV